MGVGGRRVTDELIQVGQMHGFECENRVYSPEGKIGGNPKKIIEVAAMRGRENGQQLEINKEGISNTVTTVAKDNMILEEYVHVNQATKEGTIPCKIGGGGGSELSNISNTQRSSARERRDLPNTDNGEYP